MKIDTIIRIHLINGNVIVDKCHYNTLMGILRSDDEFLVSKENIIPKINIDFIETNKINESEEN